MKKHLFLLLLLFQGVIINAQATDLQRPLTLRSVLSDASKFTVTENATSTKKPSLTYSTIESIEIKGLSHLSLDAVQSRLSIRKGDRVNDVIIRRNVKNIQEIGVFDSVDYELIPGSTESIKKLIITVQETASIGDIQFDGLTLYKPEELLPLIQLKPGDLLSYKLLRKDKVTLDEHFQSNGYTKASIYSITTPKEDGDPLIFHLREGLIEEIIITGNYRTREYVISRELSTHEGDVFNSETFTEDIRRVYNLNYFDGIDPQLLPGELPNAYKLQLNILEKESTAQVSFGGGYSPTSGFSVFSDLFWENLRGTGQTILLKGQFSGKASTYQIRYHNPWMWDDRKSLTLKFWRLNGGIEAISPINNDFTFQQQRSLGIEATVGLPYTYNFRSSHTVKHESVVLTDDNRDYRIDSYKLGFSYDTRDFAANPLNGVYHSFSIEQSVGLYENSLFYTKADLNLRQFIQTFSNQTIALRLSTGVITSDTLSDDLDLYARELYRLGGSNTIRGWGDTDPVAIGNKKMLLSAEYRYNFNKIIQGIAFVDAGMASYSRNQVFGISHYRVGKGIGLRIQSPLGPLRLDYALNDEGDTYIHFNIGQTF